MARFDGLPGLTWDVGLKPSRGDVNDLATGRGTSIVGNAYEKPPLRDGHHSGHSLVDISFHREQGQSPSQRDGEVPCSYARCRGIRTNSASFIISNRDFLEISLFRSTLHATSSKRDLKSSTPCSIETVLLWLTPAPFRYVQNGALR